MSLPIETIPADDAGAPRGPIRRWLAYPPLLLMTLTTIALLLALGTAHAGEPPAATDLAEAARQLGRATYDDLSALVAADGTFVVSESWGVDGESEEVWRQTYTADIDALTWQTDVQPALRLLDEPSSATEAAITCSADGICRKAADGYRLRLELRLEDGTPKLLGIHVAWDEILGC